MAYEDLRSFLRTLEREGELRRIKVQVDPYLEVGEITDRVQKAHGPALLFENVKGSELPLAMNVFGTQRRLCLALGIKSLDEIGERIGELLKPELPHGLSGFKDALGKVAQLRSVPPKHVKGAPCQQIVLTDDQVDLNALPALHT